MGSCPKFRSERLDLEPIILFRGIFRTPFSLCTYVVGISGGVDSSVGISS